MLTDLVVELSQLPPPAQVRAALARTLGDPSLDIAFWLPDQDRYVDLVGGPLELPRGGERAVTVLEHEQERLAALVYDPSLLEDPALVQAAGAAARLALENARLQAELRAQLGEVRASRARIVEAGDAERRRLERDLHDGAQQRLLGIRLALRLVRGQLADGRAGVDELLTEAEEELEGTLSELRALAHGIHPAVLTEEGLAPALETLARRASIPVSIASMPDERFPAPLEAAAYFVASEALANVTKHAQASRVTIGILRERGNLVIDVSDDGIGGADSATGSGLLGLRDRVEALNGTFRTESPPGQGTRAPRRDPMRVILADDAAVIREGLARLLTEAGFDVVGQVGDASDLLACVDRHRPDVAIVDIRMPPTYTDEGLVAAREIRAAHPDVGVLVLSQYVDVAYAMKLVTGEAQRVGYLLKDRIGNVPELAAAIVRIAEGGSVVDPDLVAELVAAPTVADPLAELTAREREVLALLAVGRTARGIGQALFVTPKTVEALVRSIFRKLDLPSNATENRRVHAVLTFLRARSRPSSATTLE